MLVGIEGLDERDKSTSARTKSSGSNNSSFSAQCPPLELTPLRVSVSSGIGAGAMAEAQLEQLDLIHSLAHDL